MGITGEELKYLVVPEGGEDEVHLNENTAKGKKPTQECHRPRSQIPLFLRNGTGNGFHTTWVVWNSTPIPAQNCS